MGTWVAGKHQIITRVQNTDVIDIILSCVRNRSKASTIPTHLALSTAWENGETVRAPQLVAIKVKIWHEMMIN
jgi:hypothetical protein